jgi:CO/xanthine dehydrogenase Mo-binding subunit
VLAMIVAETLGVPLDRVDVVNSDTAIKPWDVGAHASRTTFIAGNAARLAAAKLRERLLTMAADELEAPVERLGTTDGWIFVRDEPGRRLRYDRAARSGHLREQGQTLVAEAFYDPPTTMLDKDMRGNVSATYGFAAQAVVLDVEAATGLVRVRRIVSAHDVGRALNPLAAEGQIHGGIHMGLGYALSERLVVEDGQVLTASFMDYAILRADDMPELVVRLIESAETEGPFGAKGLGESGVIPVSAAVAIAELPITPAAVRAALARSETRR